MQTIVEVACNSVPGFDHVGIATLERTDDIETRAVTGALVLLLDEVLYGTDAFSVSSMRHEQRWPDYVPRARAAGVRSQLAVKLYLGQGTLGGIHFYSTTSDDVSEGECFRDFGVDRARAASAV